MTNKRFKELLKKANLNKKQFSEVAKISYNTVKNWQNIPMWVETWLENYIKAKAIDEIKNIFCKESQK